MFSYDLGTPCTLTVDDYGEVGGDITGEFNGSFLKNGTDTIALLLICCKATSNYYIDHLPLATKHNGEIDAAT